MIKFSIITTAFIALSLHVFAYGGWTICNTPPLDGRIDDMYMVDTQTGYAVTIGGEIIKTTDGGNNWLLIKDDSSFYRSVEFINAQKGFVGGLDYSPPYSRILFKTLDGGTTWTDLTPLMNTIVKGGICGLAIPDSNTIYGCGNYYRDSAYIIKSVDGGNTWSFIDMQPYATHLIDMYFLNKDTGFATGTGPLPLATAVILYTTDGGQTWTYKFQNNIASEWCWKIQHLSDQIYFASVEEAQFSTTPSRILKSIDGGMTWNVIMVDSTTNQDLQGIGFIDSLKGWTGGWGFVTFETNDGGITWDTNSVCVGMNRLIKVNDTLLFAAGFEIWKYISTATGITPAALEVPQYAFLNCNPNPVDKSLTVDIILEKYTHALIILLDNNGKRIKIIDTALKQKGHYQYQVDTERLTEGTYFVVLKTHEDQRIAKVIVTH